MNKPEEGSLLGGFYNHVSEPKPALAQINQHLNLVQKGADVQRILSELKLDPTGNSFQVFIENHAYEARRLSLILFTEGKDSSF